MKLLDLPMLDFILFYSLGIQTEATCVAYLNYKLDFIFGFRISTRNLAWY